MTKLVFVIAACLVGGAAWAQQVTPAPAPTAGACAYNVLAPSPIAGGFYYIQCDSQGRIIVK